MAPKRPRGGADAGGTPPKKPPQTVGGVDASKSVSGAQDATFKAAEGGRSGSGSNGTSPSNGTTTPAGKTDPPGTPDRTSPSDAGDRDGGTLQERSEDPQSPTKDADSRNTVGDPIDIATGEMVLRQTDVRLPGLLPLVLDRTHLSSYRVGLRFGPSWTSTLDQRLEIGGTAVSFAAADGKLLVAADPAIGSTARFSGSLDELTRHDDGGYALTEFRTGRTLFFAPGGRVLPLTAIVDRNGHRLDFDYDDAGTPVEVRHSGGYRIRVESADGLVTALYLRAADNGDDVPLMRYAYEGRRLTEVVNASGLPMRFTYDHAGRITSWTDRNDEWYRFGYDHEGRVVAGEGAGDFLSGTMEYDRENRITRWTDSRGARTTYHLDDGGRTVREVDPLGGETLSEWGEHDRLLSRTDPLGRTIRYEYDDAHNLVAVTRPDGSQVRYEHNDLRLPTTVIAPDGTVSRREYDSSGNLTAVTDPAGAVTRYSYDERGHLVSVTNALGGVRTVRTDAAGLPVALTDAAGATTRYERDAFGRATAVIDPLGGTTRFGWTVDGKPAWRTLPDGATERWLYDGEGNLRTHVDALGNTTRTEVTHFDLPSAEIRPDGARLEFGYDTELRLTSVTNEQGLVWRYEYDPAGNLRRETDFNGRTVTYAHDAAGQLTARTNGAGQTTTFLRNVLGEVVQRRTADGISTFTYDPLGRLSEARDPDTRITFHRDAVGRVLAETVNGRAITSAYDALGRRIRRRTPSGAESVWEYDATDRPVAFHAAGRTLRFAYDAAGHETSRTLGPSAVLEQEWSPNHRLLAQRLVGSTGRGLQQRSYTYRPDGLLTGIDDSLTGPRLFDLDLVGRVTAVRAPGWTERYAYDLSGNLTEADWPAPVESTDAAASGSREYSGTLVRRAGAVRYEYDAQGRLVLRQHRRLSRKPATWRYFWDAEDRLTGVLTPDGERWHYRYDALGRRTAKQRLAPDNRVLEQVDFTWDGVVPAEQAHADGADLTTARVTVWDHEPWSYRPLAQRERSPLRDAPQKWIDDEFYSIVADLVGSPAELVNDQGGIAWFGRTTLWGRTLDQSRTGVSVPLRFPGQYFDAESGLCYNFHRYYDATTARYASTDPLGLAGGSDPHSYVSHPAVMSDPLGLATECDPRYQRGTATGSNGIPDVTGQWLRPDPAGGGLEGQFPGQIARQLEGREFNSFDDFRKAFWEEVSKDPQLASQFNPDNQGKMADGKAPFAPGAEHHGKHGRFILHHITPIHHGGAVYDMNNIMVVSPRRHQTILPGDYHFGSS